MGAVLAATPVRRLTVATTGAQAPKSHRELFNALSTIPGFVGVAKEGRRYVVTTCVRSTMIHATGFRTLRDATIEWWQREVRWYVSINQLDGK